MELRGFKVRIRHLMYISPADNGIGNVRIVASKQIGDLRSSVLGMRNCYKFVLHALGHF